MIHHTHPLPWPRPVVTRNPRSSTSRRGASQAHEPLQTESGTPACLPTMLPRPLLDSHRFLCHFFLWLGYFYFHIPTYTCSFPIVSRIVQSIWSSPNEPRYFIHTILDEKILVQIWGIGCDPERWPRAEANDRGLFIVDSHLTTHPSDLPLVQSPHINTLAQGTKLVSLLADQNTYLRLKC